MRHRWIAPVLATVLTVSALPPTATAAQPPTPDNGAPPSTRITLVTGDRVQVSRRPGQPERVVFEPGPTSRSTAAVTTYSGGHTYVVPEAAREDVRSGRLDRALFDVTTLLAEGQDDATTKTLPVIVRYAQKAALKGVTSSRALTSIGARAAKVDKSRARDFLSTPGIQKVSLDRKVKVQLDESVPQIGGPAAWQRGLTGKGVKIAVLDSGIDPNHADFTGRIGAQQNFTDTADTVDHHGHGTHVASIAAGTGAASGGKYKGVAPDATLLVGKVLDDTGSGSFSGIIAGMEWAVAQGADVVNLSLGSQEPSDGTDDVSQALNRLSGDTLFVVAAGNCFFPQPGSITSPGAADKALAVGNLERDGSLSSRSCRGPRAGDGAVKPELSAPGTGIVAARAAGTELGEPVDDNYTAASGTSMASPYVAGTAALIAQAHPDWNADQLKAQLISTADPQQARVDEEGAGRVDADQATDQSVTVDTGELELGTLRWPFPAKEQLAKVLTYTNPTAQPVTLQLSASIDPAQAAPTFSTTQLVVPANGSAQATVTFDRAAAGAGKYSGRITATPANSDPVVTTFGWYAEPEMYDLAIQGISKDGSAAQTEVNIARLDGDPTPDNTVPLKDGKATARLAPGRYVVSALLFTDPTDTRAQEYSVLSSNEIHVDKNSAVTLDARKAKPIDVTAQGANGLQARERMMGFTVKNGDGVTTGGTGVSWTGAARLTSATPTTQLTTGSSEFALGARLEQPPYKLKVKGKETEVLDFYFGPRFTGTKTLPLYDAGTATPDELKGVKGKLALIKLSDSDPRWNGQVVRAAEDAGAAAALLYNPDVPGMNGLFSYWAYGDQDATIPAMRTSRAIAQALLKGGPKTVELTGLASTPYVYDLMQPWKNRIPAVGTHVVKRNQLARVDETFGSHTDGMQTSEARGTLTPGGNEFGGWLVPTFATPYQRTSYVQADTGLTWQSGVYYNNTDDGEAMETHGAPATYRPGTRTSERWLAPVLVSGLPDGVQGVMRAEGGLLVQVSPFQHQQEYAAPYNNGGSLLTLERNGEEVGVAEDTGIWLELPDDAASYRATLDTRRENKYWKYSTQVKSTWTWKSKGGADEVMPFISAGLDVPQADARSQVRTGKPTTITLKLHHQTGSQSAAKFSKPKLSVSYDGSTWTALALKQTAGGWTTTVTHPNSQAGQTPSLKLSAQDSDGNTLVQEVTRAYGLVR
ncbi:S8 family serine peptidase [Kribbella sp. NPDC051770]|uniref:S8 family serine peptidase n=1 Tax=Kribbella sp. NPDC051770 TaxID=3155413 RepID=UPI00342ED259